MSLKSFGAIIGRGGRTIDIGAAAQFYAASTSFFWRRKRVEPKHPMADKVADDSQWNHPISDNHAV